MKEYTDTDRLNLLIDKHFRLDQWRAKARWLLLRWKDNDISNEDVIGRGRTAREALDAGLRFLDDERKRQRS